VAPASLCQSGFPPKKDLFYLSLISLKENFSAQMLPQDTLAVSSANIESKFANGQGKIHQSVSRFPE